MRSSLTGLFKNFKLYNEYKDLLDNEHCSGELVSFFDLIKVSEDETPLGASKGANPNSPALNLGDSQGSKSMTKHYAAYQKYTKCSYFELHITNVIQTSLSLLGGLIQKGLIFCFSVH